MNKTDVDNEIVDVLSPINAARRSLIVVIDVLVVNKALTHFFPATFTRITHGGPVPRLATISTEVQY